MQGHCRKLKKGKKKMKKRTLSIRIVTILLVIVLSVPISCIKQNGFMPDIVKETISLDNSTTTIVAKAASTKKQKNAAYNKKAKKAYKKFLKKIKKQTKKEDGSYCDGYPVYYDQAEYSFSDVNNDGKLELVLLPGWGTGVGNDLYVYKKGKVKYIGTVGIISIVYKRGNMFFSSSGGGVSTGRWHKLKNGKLKLVAIYSSENGKIDPSFCKKNGKTISVKKMKKFIKKMSKKKTVNKLKKCKYLKNL